MILTFELPITFPEKYVEIYMICSLYIILLLLHYCSVYVCSINYIFFELNKINSVCILHAIMINVNQKVTQIYNVLTVLLIFCLLLSFF